VNCKEVIDLIDAYLDGELDPVTNNNIEAHLRECSRCERAFKHFIRAIGTAAPYHKSPQTLRERLQAVYRDNFVSVAAR
jgi:anti-sigma factor RsiW